MSLPRDALPGGALFLVLALASCTGTRHDVQSSETPRPAPSPVATPESFPATALGAAGRPKLTRVHARAVRAILAASSPLDRARLIVSLTTVEDAQPHTLILFYGDARFPNGVFPPGTTKGGATANGIPVPTQAAYHVIGAGCNLYYKPSSGEEFAVPGDGAGCTTWKPDAADRIAKRYGLGD